MTEKKISAKFDLKEIKNPDALKHFDLSRHLGYFPFC